MVGAEFDNNACYVLREHLWHNNHDIVYAFMLKFYGTKKYCAPVDGSPCSIMPSFPRRDGRQPAPSRVHASMDIVLKMNDSSALSPSRPRKKTRDRTTRCANHEAEIVYYVQKENSHERAIPSIRHEFMTASREGYTQVDRNPRFRSFAEDLL